MIREIGSIFPLTDTFSEKEKDYRIPGTEYLSLCREALLCLARTVIKRTGVVMIPAYTCQTIIDAFEQEKWTCRFYGVGKDLRIDGESFNAVFARELPDVVVAHPYYGCGLSDGELRLLESAKEKGAVLVCDVTQSLYLERDTAFFDYYVGSYRKWFPIPDGAFLQPAKPIETLEENKDFVVLQKDAMYLRGQYFATEDAETKQISIRLNKRAVSLIAGQSIEIHRISDYSDSVLKQTDFEASARRRAENYAYLFSNLKQSANCTFVKSQLDETVSAPLYFPIYVDNRAELQKKLAENRIYAPVLWPVSDMSVLINENVRYIYDHILLLPVDQRYDTEDMERIVSIMNKESLSSIDVPVD